MAQRFLFFNSTSDDRRKYDAKDFSDYFGSVLSTGVLHVDEQPGLFVSVEQGTMNTIVGPGKAIMKGHLYENTTPHTLTHSLPEPNLDRIDRIVLRLDLRQSQRNILLHVKEGQPAENPEPPALQRDNLIYEISLARILVRRNTSSLQPIDLQDERLDEDVCGLVYSLISIPTSQFQEQWETFYNTIKDEMDTETQAYFQQLAQNILQFEQDWDAWFSNQKTEGFVMQNEKGQPNGVASLDENAKVPLEQLPPLDFIPTSEKGAPGGVATLDNNGNLVQKPYVIGTYTGNGLSTRLINLGFHPTAVLVTTENGGTFTEDGGERTVYGGLATRDTPLSLSGPEEWFSYALMIETSGFRVYQAERSDDLISRRRNVWTNQSGVRYNYIAFR